MNNRIAINFFLKKKKKESDTYTINLTLAISALIIFIPLLALPIAIPARPHIQLHY